MKEYDARILDKLLAKKGDVIDMALIQKSADYLQDRLQKKACLFSMEVTPIVEKQKNMPQANLVFKAKAGASAHYGKLTVTGNERVKTSVIEQAVHLESTGPASKPVNWTIRSWRCCKRSFLPPSR